MLSTKSKASGTNNIFWSQNIEFLAATKRIPQSIEKLKRAGFNTLADLLWIVPLRSQKMSSTRPFSAANPGELFWGEGKVLNIKFSPAYGRRGKGRSTLFNLTLVVKDLHSADYLTLKWFNSYPSIKKQVETLDTFQFIGEFKEYQGIRQVINPKLNPSIEPNSVMVEYPTIATVQGKYIQKLIKKIPESYWAKSYEPRLDPIYSILQVDRPMASFSALHGIAQQQKSSPIDRIIYEEFLVSQLKVLARKLKYKQKKAPIINISSDADVFLDSFPYQLTEDQNKVISQIREDLSSGTPMMRIVQGDVGCGKTTVALVAMNDVITSGAQSALMCPTESLAQQHFKEAQTRFPKQEIILLTGSISPKDKKIALEKIATGLTKIIIGTHALFQDSTIFQNLALVIIDEQHKFGVEQRHKLVSKGQNAHCLIMSATPIPRTLQLAQYGDLDISTIFSIPPGRKGTKTRMVTAQTYQKFLSFVKTRLELKEQIYIVVPAIEESELEINFVEGIYEEYIKFFPNQKIEKIHGRINSEDKDMVMKLYKDGHIDLLISTSVIEVGIDNPNATVMAIYNPERFGLSSLHQLRGRVGRGSLPGFCFLITDQSTTTASKQRLRVLEKSSNGFDIAEFDLQNRGEGDLFGKNQSGANAGRKVASLITHLPIFEQVINDINKLSEQDTKTLSQLSLFFLEDLKVSSTI